jgi:sugar phosphate isomerase/epimerase
MTVRSFSTRLNSFGIGLGKKYPDESWTTVMLIAEAAKVKGLTSLELNYPEHFLKNSVEEVQAALKTTNLNIKGIQLRWPAPRFSNGGFANDNDAVRREAIDLVKGATKVARQFGTDHVLLWPAHDGYEYPLQMD